MPTAVRLLDFIKPSGKVVGEFPIAMLSENYMIFPLFFAGFIKVFPLPFERKCEFV